MAVVEPEILYLGLMKLIRDPGKMRTIDKIASEYVKKLRNDNGLNQYLFSMNPDLDIPKESLSLKAGYEKEQLYPSEMSSFLAYEQVLMGTLLAKYNGYIGQLVPTDLTPLYLSLKQALHYLENFSKSIEAKTGYTLYYDNHFPQEHIDKALSILKQNPFIFPDKPDSFNENIFMHHLLFSVQPKASADTNSHIELELNIQPPGTHKNTEEPAPKHQPSLGNAGQHSQEDQAGSPDEGLNPQAHQQSAPQAKQAGRKLYTVFVGSTFEDMKDIRAAVLQQLNSSKEYKAIGMEDFTAADGRQLEYIKDRFKDTDIYVLILGGRYGSLIPKTRPGEEDKSYTQKEYEMAMEDPDIRVLAFLCSNPGDLPEKKRWKDDKEHELLTKFRDKVKDDHTFMPWGIEDSPEKIAANVYQSLTQMDKSVLRGWVRGTSGSSAG